MVCLNFEGDSVEHLSVTHDGPDDRRAFQLRNAPFVLIVESGSAEVAERPNGTVELVLFYHHTESVCACILNELEFSSSRNNGFEIWEGQNVGTRQIV